MIGMEFRTDDVPADERFDRWRELIDRTRANDTTSPHAAGFRAEMRVLELGLITVWRTSFSPAHFRRNARRIRRGDAEYYHLSLLTEGGLTQVQERGTSATIGPRGLLVDSSWQACEALAHATRLPADGRPGTVAGVGVDLPRALLPLPARQVEGLLGRGLSVRNGPGALLAEFLLGLDRQAVALRPADAPRLGEVTLGLVSASFAHALDTEDVLPAETRHEVLARQVRAFIQQHLRDVQLTPGTVAAAHHISLSHLHRVFGEQSPGDTVAAWIRSQRLERIRADLADPSLRTRPIHVLAARWGMPRASQFTRAFRAAYGISPRDYRHQALSGRR
ncbi:AraC family transcriptional regulator [Streptomyces sp. FBKL.4005]|uniref:helix-turn-helix domain-containing protein n=1 Tax=Streptomyces sp. FBKL.4005 TaxID=2015515 RepID=UPI000B971D71|nr:AraC family transcriptional regulator [Streptomyces sp. FBKL.4005]